MYRTVDTGIWTDPKIKGLSSETKLLWLYLLTNNHTHVSGLYYLPEIYISHETGLPSKTLTRGLKDLSDLGVIMYDTFTETVWVKKMLRRQAGDKFEKNHLRAAVVKQLKSMLENPLLPDYLVEYQDLNLEIVSPLQGASKGLESPAVTVPVTDIEKGGVGEKTKSTGNNISPEAKKAVEYYMTTKYYPQRKDWNNQVERDRAVRSCQKLIDEIGLDRLRAILMRAHREIPQWIEEDKMKQPFKATNFFGKAAHWCSFDGVNDADNSNGDGNLAFVTDEDFE